MPNLRDNIKAEIERGQLEDTFTPSAIINIRQQGDYCFVNKEKYKKSSIREILANHSIGPSDRKGESVKRGGEIFFIKHGEASYSIFEENIDDINEEKENSITNNSLHIDQHALEKNGEEPIDIIARQFVEYLRHKPYRIKKNNESGSRWLPIDGPVCGWKNRLNEYYWNRTGWADTQKIIANFILDLKSLKRNIENNQPNLEVEAKRIYDSIKRWGNPKGINRDGDFVLRCLKSLWTNQIPAVDSTLTKLYAFGDPDNYVIYDSRVATAILSIAEDIYRYRTINGKRIETVNIMFHQFYKNIGKYDGSGGTRPRAFRWSCWPTAYKSINAQLEANDLCHRIVSILNSSNEDGRSNWSMREVEAVLFMEGY